MQLRLVAKSRCPTTALASLSRVSCAALRGGGRCGAPSRCAASLAASACGKATLPNYGLGFGWAGFHAPTLVGGADAAHLQGAPHLLRPRLVAKPRCPTTALASLGRGFMRRPSRGVADAAHLQGAPHLLRPRLVAKPRCPTTALASLSGVSCAVPREGGRCGAPARCAASLAASACGKATLPNYGLGFAQQGFMRRPSRGVTDAAHLQGAPHLLRPRLVAKPRCPTTALASLGQGFMRHPHVVRQMPSIFKMLGICLEFGSFRGQKKKGRKLTEVK